MIIKNIELNPRVGKYNNPKSGKGDDKAHPPIYPVRYSNDIDLYLNPKEKKVYDLIIAHFLVSISPNAKAKETTISVKMGGEYFKSKGLSFKMK